MNIKQFEVVGKCLFWREERMLVVGDLHLGYEDDMLNKGLAVPRVQIEETYDDLLGVFDEVGKVKKVILLGDVKHYFGSVLGGEWRDVYKVMNLIKKNLLEGGDVVVTKGNHDAILEKMTKFYAFVELVDYYVYEGVLFLHGDKKSFDKTGLNIFRKDVVLVVIGHFHPAIGFSRGAKREIYKCFLVGKSKELKKELIVVPSFFPLNTGVNVLGRTKPGFLEGQFDVRKFEVFAIEKSFVWGFGVLGKLM